MDNGWQWYKGAAGTTKGGGFLSGPPPVPTNTTSAELPRRPWDGYGGWRESA